MLAELEGLITEPEQLTALAGCSVEGPEVPRVGADRRGSTR
ncbi:hypothetical protein [Streptomyces sp. NBC_01207]|nr:hypothetical protein OG457_01350 [Streptomyces sp. NBC_01207]